jgi:hypothetical protein
MNNDLSYIAINTWIKKYKININYKVIDNLLLAKGKKGVIKKISLEFLEKDLNEIAIENNLYCNLENEKEIEEPNAFLYYLDVYRFDKKTNFIKIGISKDVNKRVKDLNRNWRDESATFVIRRSIEFKHNIAYTIEQSIIKILNITSNQLPDVLSDRDGYTEIFEDRSFIGSIFDDLD